MILGENGLGQSDEFPPTHWSMVIAAGKAEPDPETARAALSELCLTYWMPLYSFVRSRGYGVHDAQDFTQGFFAYLIEHKIYTRADREKGRFRSFLLASLKNFMADAVDRERTIKRGGGQSLLPLREEQARAAEAFLQTYHGAEDQVFERSWAEALVAAGMQRLSAAYDDAPKKKLFKELRIFLAGGVEAPPSYADLARRLGMTESTLRSHVTRLRARYREALREEVRRTVASEAEVDEELHELLRVLSKG